MRVTQLVGRYAGQEIDMPYHVAQRCIAAGTARPVGQQPAVVSIDTSPDVDGGDTPRRGRRRRARAV